MSDLSPKFGDVNGDGVVNQVDVALALMNFGVPHATHAQGDIVGDPENTGTVSSATPDGVIDSDDLSGILGSYSP